MNWVDQRATAITTHILQLVDKEIKDQPEGTGKALLVNIIACLVGTTMYKTLKERPMGKNNKSKQAEDAAIKSFAQAKHQIQHAVASGVQGAVQTYSGQPLEYYCQINLMPKPISTASN